MKKIVLLLISMFLFCACAPSATPEAAGPLELTSSAFTHEGSIPADYTCKGKNTSPALAWTQPPAGTKSFALTLDDPDASGTYVHWVIFKIPASARGLYAAVLSGAELGDAIIQCRNSAGVNGSLGPSPPALQ